VWEWGNGGKLEQRKMGIGESEFWGKGESGNVSNIRGNVEHRMRNMETGELGSGERWEIS